MASAYFLRYSSVTHLEKDSSFWGREWKELELLDRLPSHILTRTATCPTATARADPLALKIIAALGASMLVTMASRIATKVTSRMLAWS